MGRTRAIETDGADFLTLAAVARRLRCSRTVIREAVCAGAIPSYRLGKRWHRIRWADVAAWLRQNRVQPTQHAVARVAEVLARESGGTAR